MGQPKAWLSFGPERLLQRVVRLVGSVADMVVVVAASGQDLPDLPAAVQVVHDPVADQGPLRGLATGLAVIPAALDFVYVTATDVPLIQPAWVERLAELAGDHELVVPWVGGRPHPLAALYRREPALRESRALLAAGQLRLTGLVDRLRARLVTEVELAAVDPDLVMLRNLNTPAEYQRALVDAGFGASGGSSTAEVG